MIETTKYTHKVRSIKDKNNNNQNEFTLTILSTTPFYCITVTYTITDTENYQKVMNLKSLHPHKINLKLFLNALPYIEVQNFIES